MVIGEAGDPPGVAAATGGTLDEATGANGPSGMVATTDRPSDTVTEAGGTPAWHDGARARLTEGIRSRNAETRGLQAGSGFRPRGALLSHPGYGSTAGTGSSRIADLPFIWQLPPKTDGQTGRTGLDTGEAVMLHGIWGLLLWPSLLTGSVPLDCKEEQGSLSHCPSISQEKLLDRVIHHAELIYRVSEESCSLFEEMFIPVPLQLQSNPAGYTCITKALPLPSSKSETQQISDEWLLQSVLMLVQSWIQPLVYLQTTLNHYDHAPDMLLNKTKWMSDKLISLEQGVVVLIKKMLDEGALTLNYSEQSLFQYDVLPDMVESIIRDYTLLSCFKKDAHKMETFLKLLKCRQADKYNCA
ncbi:somatolactin alpha [Pholidichthys leucotaenia]